MSGVARRFTGGSGRAADGTTPAANQARPNTAEQVTPFTVETADGSRETHRLIRRTAADGSISTIVASDPTDVNVFMDHYEGRIPTLPEVVQTNGVRSTPRGDARRALEKVRRATAWLAHPRAGTDPAGADAARDRQQFGIQDLLTVFAEHGRPATPTTPEASGAQQIYARITVRVAPGATPLEMDKTTGRP
ncbi:hypothetical protein [Lentzea atacamensis]|uniref:hypothetical protein n=1 Tax=Lentzea atacamensis TaxID=531938 RepID=UPI000DD30030|nr:hypothetical protein [Lentzea atacamensis]